jgi:hypothetical protein
MSNNNVIVTIACSSLFLLAGILPDSIKMTFGFFFVPVVLLLGPVVLFIAASRYFFSSQACTKPLSVATRIATDLPLKDQGRTRVRSWSQSILLLCGSLLVFFVTLCIYEYVCNDPISIRKSISLAISEIGNWRFLIITR